MKALKCPSCGADVNISENSDYGYCEFCGTKVMQEKIIVEHRVDKSGDYKNFIQLANKAYERKNYQEAYNYYSKAFEIQQDDGFLDFRKSICKGYITQSDDDNYEIVSGIKYAFDHCDEKFKETMRNEVLSLVTEKNIKTPVELDSQATCDNYVHALYGHIKSADELYYFIKSMMPAIKVKYINTVISLCNMIKPAYNIKETGNSNNSKINVGISLTGLNINRVPVETEKPVYNTPSAILGEINEIKRKFRTELNSLTDNKDKAKTVGKNVLITIWEKFKKLSFKKKLIVIFIILILFMALVSRLKPNKQTDSSVSPYQTTQSAQEADKEITYTEVTESGITFSIPSTFEHKPSIAEYYYDFRGDNEEFTDRAGLEISSVDEYISPAAFKSNKTKLCENIDSVAGKMLSDIERTYADYIKVDGLNALRCKYEGLDEGEESNVEIICINNPDNGCYVLLWTMFYEDCRGKYYSVFEDVLDSADVDLTVTTEKTTTEKSAEKGTEKETQKEVKKTGIDPEFKEFWDSYVKFMDSYVNAMKDPGSSDYLRALADYEDFIDKAAEYEDDDNLTDEELKYMAAAQAKIVAKYAEAALLS